MQTEITFVTGDKIVVPSDFNIASESMIRDGGIRVNLPQSPGVLSAIPRTSILYLTQVKEEEQEPEPGERLTPSGFPSLVTDSLWKARSKHKDMKCAHEAYAVILEELEEVWDEVKKKTPDRAQLLKELTHTAAMCQRAAEDLGLIT